MTPIRNYIIKSFDEWHVLVFESVWNTDQPVKAILTELEMLKSSSEDIEVIQFMNSKYLISINHVLSAVWHAMKAKNSGLLIAKEASTEILLYCSLQRQIHKAIETFGINNSTEKIVGLIISTSVDSIFKVFKEIKEKYTLDLSFPLITPNKDRLNDVKTTVLKNTDQEMDFNETEIQILEQIALLALK